MPRCATCGDVRQHPDHRELTILYQQVSEPQMLYRPGKLTQI